MESTAINIFTELQQRFEQKSENKATACKIISQRACEDELVQTKRQAVDLINRLQDIAGQLDFDQCVVDDIQIMKMIVSMVMKYSNALGKAYPNSVGVCAECFTPCNTKMFTHHEPGMPSGNQCTSGLIGSSCCKAGIIGFD